MHSKPALKPTAPVHNIPWLPMDLPVSFSARGRVASAISSPVNHSPDEAMLTHRRASIKQQGITCTAMRFAT